VSIYSYLAAALGGLAVPGGVVAAAIDPATESGIAASRSARQSRARSSSQAVGAVVGAAAQASRQPLVQLDLIATGQAGVLEIRHREHIGAGVVGVEAPQLGLARPGRQMVAVMGANCCSTCKRRK